MAYQQIPLTLEQHQQVLYEILYMVDDFCKAHDISYFLVGGTLLGAVRHQGIIPWDDDADIAMTRENYQKFIDLFHTQGVTGYELYDCEHVDGYLFPFAKMAKNTTWTASHDTHKIHIDIFVYDGCGDTLVDARKYFSKNRSKIQKFVDKYIWCVPFNKLFDCWKAKLFYIFTQFPKDVLGRWLSPHWPLEYLKKVTIQCAKLSINNTKYGACIVWGIYGEGEVQLSSSFLNLDKKRFGTRELPVPSGWHEYLSGIYGDYMTPLPECERHQHIQRNSYLIVNQ